MYRVVEASAAGDVVLWRTPAAAAAGTPAPPAAVLTPWGEKTEAPATPESAPGGACTLGTSTADSFCAALEFTVLSRRKIVNGDVLFVKTPDGEYLVVKHQRPAPCSVNEVATPGPAVCEMRALHVLNRLMSRRRVAPVFCELWRRGCLASHAVMRAYVTDLSDWLRGDGRDPGRACRGRPSYPAPADQSDAWLYTRCAGHSLAVSEFPSDRKLFNDVLRTTMLQVFLGLAQAQRHALFTHNDLHGGNVMFEHVSAGVSRLFVTGAGSFLLPRRAARARVIDFQHACFYDGDERVAGARDDVHNAFALAYDVWRLCSNVLWQLLRPHYDAVDQDLLAMLSRGAHTEPGEFPPAVIEAEVHWKPYLLDGPTPEDMLADPAFDRSRCAPDAAADDVWFEQTPSPQAQRRYALASVFCRRGVALPVPRDVAYAAMAPPPRVVHEEARRRLAVFAANYEGTALGRASLYFKHTPASRARFLFMELCLLQAALDHLWSPACAAEVEARAGDDSLTCALADGIGVVLHADYCYIARPEALTEYNALVVAAARSPCAALALCAPPRGSGLSAAEEARLLAVTQDGHLERWRGVFVRAVLQG